jgi:hypothetical protein
VNCSPRRLLSLALPILTFACGESATPFDPPGALLAKGGTTTQRVDFTITDAGLSLASDGKGIYSDGVCGSWGSWADVLFLAPAYSKVPKSQQAACAGLAPRVATVTLAVRHVSDDPHVDDAASPGSGTFSVQNVKFGYGAALATIINATGSMPFCGTLGLRYTSVTFPGTSDVVRDDVGGGLWHMYTRPWPDNVAYCENGGVAAYWHVSLDLHVQILGG